MAVRLLPNSELVAVSYFQQLPGLHADVVATQLPKNEADWAADGAITVQVVGGHPDADLPVRNPLVQVDCWATTLNSNKPPWFKAAALAEACWQGTRNRNRGGRRITITAGPVDYPAAIVLTAFFLTEWRRVYDDKADAARYSADLAMSWAPADPIFEPA
jgi:hypothetical protein